MEEIFIINPKAGGDDPEVIASNVRKIYPDAEIVFTTAAGQIPELVSGYGGRRVFVVGGDGTFYEDRITMTGAAAGILPPEAEIPRNPQQCASFPPEAETIL